MLAAGCASQPRDYTSYRAHLPRSVLVLPPLNEGIEVDASYRYLSTISRPLAEAGYYVFPVAVVDAFMKENGLPTPGEMHAVSLEKIREVFGADAVLYVTIEEYGQKYQIISSSTIVKARARMVDVVTGATLWEGRANAYEGSGDSGGDPLAAIVMAGIAQVLESATDHAHELSSQVNHQMIFNSDSGLLLGPYSPGHEADARGR